MQKGVVVIGLALFFVHCSSPSPRREPSSSPASTLPSREGKPVAIPGLKRALDIPPCSTNGPSHEECVAANEPALFDEITRLAFTFQTAQNPASEKISQRDFHPKQHACLAGVWTPISGLSSDLATGAFAVPGPVKAVVRFSNGSPKSPAGNGQIAPDGRPDARGLGIKLVGISGESILDVEDPEAGRMNQDFVLINQSSFFLRSPKSYPEFFKQITMGKPFFSIMDPVEIKVLKATNRVVPDVIQERFFSQTPYVLGDRYAKYSVRPCESEKVAPVTDAESKDASFLRARIRRRLDSQPICLLFSIQLKRAGMDVEDAAIEWPESSAKFTDVAKIVIPSGQNIDDRARDAYCENISFNPWNSLAENRPAGGINRARLAAYAGVSRKRRTENNVQIREPRVDDSFFDVLK